MATSRSDKPAARGRKVPLLGLYPPRACGPRLPPPSPRPPKAVPRPVSGRRQRLHAGYCGAFSANAAQHGAGAAVTCSVSVVGMRSAPLLLTLPSPPLLPPQEGLTALLGAPRASQTMHGEP